jgi:ZPR1 zinc finger protein
LEQSKQRAKVLHDDASATDGRKEELRRLVTISTTNASTNPTTTPTPTPPLRIPTMNQGGIEPAVMGSINIQHLKDVANTTTATTTTTTTTRQSDDLHYTTVMANHEREDENPQQLLLLLGGGGMQQQQQQEEEVMKFPTICSHCQKEAETNMTMKKIPHFKEVLIMCLVCDHCGYRSCEVKGGGGAGAGAGGSIPLYGSKITVSIACINDLDRHVLKSDTAGIQIPDVDLQLQEGGLNGFYTTIQGLLLKIVAQLKKANPFPLGDSGMVQQQEQQQQHRSKDDLIDDSSTARPNRLHTRYMTLLQTLEEMSQGRILPFTLIVTDPLSNSYVSPIPNTDTTIAFSQKAIQDANSGCDDYDSYVDPGILYEDVPRTDAQNEALGLNDILTEGY